MNGKKKRFLIVDLDELSKKRPPDFRTKDFSAWLEINGLFPQLKIEIADRKYTLLPYKYQNIEVEIKW